MLALAVAALGLGLGSCGRGPFDTPPPPPDMACIEAPDTCRGKATLEAALDILFVIDNSGSMGAKQGTLAASFPRFIEVLETESNGASYRIGLTTTDRQGLRLSSCRGRLSEFIWHGDPFDIDSRAEGCLDPCQHDTVTTIPTSTTDDPSPAARPWLEKSQGKTNIAGGISMSDALSCVGPQGIDGSGFEAPLESMLTVLDYPEGFLRDEALLAVVVVTDEADCSMSSANLAALETPAAEPLWSDPSYGISSAVCWNAGVTCVGGPGVYDDCHAEDKGFDAKPVDQDPVLYPVQRYIDALETVARDKEARGGNGRVLVAMIDGVPEDYPQGGEIVYRDSEDPTFQLEYGIGPGCDWGNETISDPRGIPPVRRRELADAFAVDGRNLFSICSADYSVALEQIAGTVATLGASSCIPGCPTDTNPHVDGLQPDCTIVEHAASGSRHAIVPCLSGPDGWELPPDVDACYQTLWDPGGTTPQPDDDMSATCVTVGSSLELAVERRDGAPLPPNTRVSIDCRLDRPADQSCSD